MVQQEKNWRDRLHEIIYEANTPAGKAFDVVLLVVIFASILTVILDSVEAYRFRYGNLFLLLELTFTFLFTVEYILRLISIRQPLKYVVSFFGIIDLLAVIPGYLSLLFVGVQSLMILRALRLLRIFRIFKLTHFLSEMKFLGGALKASFRKIAIFMLIVLTLVTIQGSVMYLVESGANGFDSIPAGIYWAIVTITTVGYGDISPVTPLGKAIASFIMLTGYAIIAVPTGIVTSEMTLALRQQRDTGEVCPNCGREGHDENARFCKFCGAKL